MDLGDRMKGYEVASRTVLPGRLPVILRVDGKAFHRYTERLERPFSAPFVVAMDVVAEKLCLEIQGAQLAYVQSDEISVLVVNFKRLNSGSWFDNQIQKMVSVAAGTASALMTLRGPSPTLAIFDARAFVLPEDEVCNYFLWRQQDATRNSVQMLARSLYSHQECFEKTGPMLQEMCWQKGHNWNDLPTHLKRGRCVHRVNGTWKTDHGIPTFSEDRAYIERHLQREY